MRWGGANYYPGRGREGSIEYTSLINIRLEPDPVTHRQLFRALLLLTPASAKQAPFVA